MKLSSLLKGYAHQTASQNLDLEVAGIAHDSRYVLPGELYVCLEGMRVDGHFFAGQAVERGAVAVLATKPLNLPVPTIYVSDTRHALSFLSDRFFAHPSRKLHIVGVTGTNGKTTTTHFLQSIYRAAGYAAAVIGTVGIRMDKEYLPGDLTTPEAFALHKTFAEMNQQNIKHVVMEVSSHSLTWCRVEHVEFNTAIFTNLTHDHLDFHKSMQKYFAAKAHLFKKLPKKENGRAQAIINADDHYGKLLLTSLDVPVFSYGLHDNAAVRGFVASTTVGETLVVIRYGNLEFEINVHLPGEYNVYNAIAAVAAALAEGIAPEAIIDGVDNLESIPGRLEAINFQQEFSIFIDFAHTPDGLEKVLTTLSALPHRRLIIVFGCPGDRDRTKRPLMGRIAEAYSDVVIVTSDNPGTESPEGIIREILQGMEHLPVVLPDRNEAVHYALSIADKGDIVLLAGKGHETYQLIGDQHIPYSDKQAVEAFFIS
ncbi:MAG: UDP-N-acetylmuramoyl-L-alanyl-D-glutamate--2,6-diaminopimelate ligase [Firmicutes bacterium]|nr:UDP-N-acetylmuramoyl-L-alanyl-D-glutamate--2,6-diaminopimelate ligase [Bacillota bacterium]